MYPAKAFRILTLACLACPACDGIERGGHLGAPAVAGRVLGAPQIGMQRRSQACLGASPRLAAQQFPLGRIAAGSGAELEVGEPGTAQEAVEVRARLGQPALLHLAAPAQHQLEAQGEWNPVHADGPPRSVRRMVAS